LAVGRQLHTVKIEIRDPTMHSKLLKIASELRKAASMRSAYPYAVADEEFYNRQYAKKEKVPSNWDEYEAEVEKLEESGLTRSDAQGVVDARLMQEGYDPNTLKKKGSVDYETYMKQHPNSKKTRNGS
jgi:hypothetical protein